MKKNEADLMLEAYANIRKKNIFVAEADDPMRVRDTSVNQYLPQRLQKKPDIADVKVPVRQPAPVEQVPESNIDPDIEHVLDMVIGDYLGANMSNDKQFIIGLKKLGKLLKVDIKKYDVDNIL